MRILWAEREPAPAAGARMHCHRARRVYLANMADDKTLRGPADRTRINVNEQHELAYWTKELGVSRDQLQAAVQSAGVMVADVRRALGK